MKRRLLIILVSDIDAFMGAGAVRQEFFALPFPVTTTIEISRLYDPNLLVEITAIAEVPRDRFKRLTGDS